MVSAHSNMEFIRRRLITPLMEQLQSGVTPEALSLSLAFGLTCGIFPIPGITTVPVMMAVFLFRLNPVAPMLVNYLATPLNFATVPVFIRLGEYFAGVDPMPFSLVELTEGLKTDILLTLKKFQWALICGVFGWAIFLIPATALLYMLLTPVMRAVSRNMKKRRDSQ